MSQAVGFGGGLVLIGIFLVWFVYHFWWFVLGCIAFFVALYYIIDYFDKRKLKKIREKNIETRIRKENKVEQEKANIDEDKRYQKFQEKLKENRKKVEEQQRIWAEQERERREKIKREREQREKQRQDRIFFQRVGRFGITEEEAEILFGRLWRKRIQRDEDGFAKEIIRIANKMSDDTEEFFIKIYDFAEKVLNFMEFHGQEVGRKYYGWDEFRCDEFVEDWMDVRKIWEEGKEQYKRRRAKKRRRKAKSEPDIFDYYQILGITRDYTIQEIKAQYRKLMLKYHPDRNKTKSAEAKCKKINEAYEVLSDPDKKARYDEYGVIS